MAIWIDGGTGHFFLHDGRWKDLNPLELPLVANDKNKVPAQNSLGLKYLERALI